MTDVLVDTHVAHWMTSEPDRLSASAAETLQGADEIVISAISWHELAWLAHHGRIAVTTPLRAWLQALSDKLRTIGITPSIAATAVGLPAKAPSDPADRLITATAIEQGVVLVSKDQRLRRFRHPGLNVTW